MAEVIDPKWYNDQVAAYEKEREEKYTRYADALREVLDKACANAIPERIVQARSKTVESFAEKCVRKFDKYKDPVHQLTDLCGARVIVQTMAQVDAVKLFIEKNFEVVEREDKSSLLGNDKFGYRDMHYLVRLRPERAERIGFKREDCAIIGQAIAEIQVRSVSQHAWADTLHDRAYKTPLKLSAEAKRMTALLAAVMEDGDRNFNWLTGEIDGMVANYTAYAKRKDVLEEIKIQRLVFDNEKRFNARARLALRLARLLGPLGEFGEVIGLLEEFAGINDVIRDELILELGYALVRQHRLSPRSAEFERGQKLLEEVVTNCRKDDYTEVPNLRKQRSLLARAYSRLGWSMETSLKPAGKILEQYRQAAITEPANPYHLANQLGYEVYNSRDQAIAVAMNTVVAQAVSACRQHAIGGTELPMALFTAGRLLLLLRKEKGKEEEALGWYARGLQHLLDKENCIFAMGILEDEEKWLDRLGDALSETPAPHDWIKRLFALARKIAAAGEIPAAEPGQNVLILAGGADSLAADLTEKIKPMLKVALKHFRGTVISGGTTAGVPGCAGAAAVELGNEKNFELVGYIPRRLPAEAPKSPGYDRFEVEIGDDTFSAGQVLRCWEDLLAKGISPRQVRLLGFGGGGIAAVEYRVAFALGARVAVVEATGNAAEEILNDEVWASSPPILALPFDEASIQAFVTTPSLQHSEAKLQEMAQAFHTHYLKDNTGKLPKNMRPWNKLDGTFKEANLAQAKYAVEILRAAGFDVRAKGGGPDAITSFRGEAFAEDVETMARLEHGRWNVDRLCDGWRYGKPRDDEKKLHDCLVPWGPAKLPEGELPLHKGERPRFLPEDIRVYDRNAIHAFPEILAMAGLEVFRRK
jgi:ppGpp synthetase/RelA/SpoT-type nucleotidyltranferase